jgi:hypothetical protein
MRVVAAHQHRRRVTVSDAREAVLEAAKRIASGVAGPESHALAEQLQRMTGATIAELAEHARDWPDT